MKKLLPLLLLLFACKTTDNSVSEKCPLLGVAYEDSPAGDKALRTWTLIDWCKYNPKTHRGLWIITDTVEYASEPVVPQKFQKKLDNAGF